MTVPQPDQPPESTRVRAPTLVGRDQELAALLRVATAAPSVAVVEGEAGIGKTRLVDALRADPRLAGAVRVVGGCRPVRDPFPLGPVIEAVRQLRQPLAAADLSPVAGAVRALLPELADLLPPAPAPVSDRRAARHRVFRALVELLRAAGPALMVLEDLHWADAHTPDFLRYLLADPPAGLSLVLTFRGEQVDPAVRALPARLPGTVGRTRIRLTPLDTAGTGALAAAILGVDQVSQEFAGYLCERASGLPFAIEELLALLRERGSVTRRHGGWARRTLDRLDVPAGVREQVLERVSHLDADAGAVLAAAAVLQNPVPLSSLATTCQLPQPRALAAVEQAMAAGMLAETDDGVGFRHFLAAQAVYETLPRLRRADLHGRAAEVLRGWARPPLGQIAHHLRHAGQTGQWIEVAEQAAEQALALGHDAEAARLLTELLRHAQLGTSRAGRIATSLATALQGTAAGGDDAVRLLQQVLARDLPGPVRGELSLLTALVMDHGRDDIARQRQLCIEAVRHLPPQRPELRALAMACLGIPISTDVTLADYRRWHQQALVELPGAEPSEQIRLLGKVAMVQVLIGDPQWRELVTRIDDLAAASDQPGHRRQAWAYYTIGVEACYAGHHELATQLLDRALRHTASWERPFQRASLLSARALVDYCRGDWHGLLSRVERLIDDLADFAPARMEAELVAGCLRLAHGDLAAARQRLGAPWDQHRAGDTTLTGLRAAAAIRLGLAGADPAAAAALVRRQLATLRRQGIWAPISRCLPVMIQALLADHDLDRARGLLEQASTQLRELDAPLASVALRHAEALLSGFTGRWREAADGLLAAAAQYESLRCPYEAAQARQAAGVQLATGQDEAAGPTLAAALATYQRLGATGDLNAAAAIARKLGVTPPTRHRRGRRGYGDQLSPRQREVARLVAAGHTNQEIADHLYLSVSTVEKHVMAVRRKLGVAAGRRITGAVPE